MSRPHHLCQFSAVAWRRISSGVPSRDFCSACEVTLSLLDTLIILVTYLLTYSAPQLHLCGTHRLSPSLAPTATCTASSSSRKPQLVMGSAKASLHCEAPLKPGTSPSALHLPPKLRLARSPGLSQTDCLLGHGTAGTPNELDHLER